MSGLQIQTSSGGGSANRELLEGDTTAVPVFDGQT
jgi:hypothetical protein